MTTINKTLDKQPPEARQSSVSEYHLPSRAHTLSLIKLIEIDDIPFGQSVQWQCLVDSVVTAFA